MLFGFGRVPGCLGLGALFLWDEWREGRTDSLPAGWGIGAALDVVGVSFLRFVVRVSDVCWFGFEGGLLGAAWVLEGSGVYV